MMDVLLVALVVFAAKTSGFATAVAQPGVWFYAVSALAGAAAAGLIKRVAAQVQVQARAAAASGLPAGEGASGYARNVAGGT